MSDPLVKELPDVSRFDASNEIQFTLAELRECLVEFRLEKTSDGTMVRFLHLRQDAKGGPRIRRFLQILDNHIVAYALQNRPEYDWADKDHFDLDLFKNAMREAREKFRRGPTTGQLGEFIVFCLVEALLGAPQAVAKMQFKGENQKEVPGVDGIHAKWDAVRHLLTLIWAEAKIEKDVVAAVRNAFTSLKECRTDGRDAEDWDLLTNHPSQLYPGLEERLKHWRKHGASSDFTVEHSYAVFIGYEDAAYTTVMQIHPKPEDLAQAFLTHYEKDHARLVAACTRNNTKVPEPWTAIDVFFLPFPDVDDLRKKFEATLRGLPVSET